MASNLDDLQLDEQWCTERRTEVIDYLGRERIPYGLIAAMPAWHIPPYVSIWAIYSTTYAESVSWWTICGDCPIDHMVADNIQHPRDALRAIAQRWLDEVMAVERGEKSPSFGIDALGKSTDFVPLLRSRASLLLGWVNDDELWQENDLLELDLF